MQHGELPRSLIVWAAKRIPGTAAGANRAHVKGAPK